MAITHDVIPLPTTGVDIYGPAELLAQSHAIDAGGIRFNDATVQTTAYPGAAANFVWTGTHAFDSQVLLTGDFIQSLTANQNDWNPANLALTNVLVASPTAARTVTGIVAGGNGRLILLYNLSTVNSLTLTSNDTLSASANRFQCPSNVPYILAPSSGVFLWYGLTKWRVQAIPLPRSVSLLTTSISANQNDYNPAGLADNDVLRVSTGGLNYDITGFVGANNGRILRFLNGDAVGTITLKNDTLSDPLTNRLYLPSSLDYTVPPQGGCTLIWIGSVGLGGWYLTDK